MKDKSRKSRKKDDKIEDLQYQIDDYVEREQRLLEDLQNQQDITEEAMRNLEKLSHQFEQEKK
jgi:hypothetical protein